MVHEWLRTAVAVLGLGTAVAAAVVLMCEVISHRRHLHQAEQDHKRLFRLSIRLAGCVAELERALEDGIEQPDEGFVPESVSGHMAYLFGLRGEASDFQAYSRVHAIRLRWPHGYLAQRSPPARRCLAAYDALESAAKALGSAGRTYDKAFMAAFRRPSSAASRRLPGRQLVMLTGKQAKSLVASRVHFEEAMMIALEHTARKGRRAPIVSACGWPIFRSEMPIVDCDLYRGEVRPLSRRGLGAEPAIHPDAR